MTHHSNGGIVNKNIDKTKGHTPTPWNKQKFDDTKATTLYAEGGAASLGSIKSLKDAEFIVYAVNNIERITKERDALLEAAKDAADIFPHLVKFLKFQRPGREFWPNREAGEATIDRLMSAIASVEGVRP